MYTTLRTKPLPGLVVRLCTRQTPGLLLSGEAVRSGTSSYLCVSVGIRVLVGAAREKLT